jgi:hypothetical protein
VSQKRVISGRIKYARRMIVPLNFQGPRPSYESLQAPCGRKPGASPSRMEPSDDNCRYATLQGRKYNQIQRAFPSRSRIASASLSEYS